MNPFTVLVVCTGNLNRSALGGALLRTWAGWYLPAPLAARVRVASAGLAAPVGSHMRSRTRAIAALRRRISAASSGLGALKSSGAIYASPAASNAAARREAIS